MDLGEIIFATFTCNFDFVSYPFDRHICPFHLIPVSGSTGSILFNSIKLSHSNKTSVKIIQISARDIAYDYKVTAIQPGSLLLSGWNRTLSGLKIELKRYIIYGPIMDLKFRK